MSVINSQSGTRVDEIGASIFRISTPVEEIPGGFTFNQFLVLDDEPLLFHTGHRRMFPLVSEAVRHVMKLEKLRYISFSHVEADETGALELFLSQAPNAVPLCGQIAVMLDISDMTDRPARVLADGEALAIGKKTIRWHDAPHVPHNWECGFISEVTTRTLFCGDLFTHAGSKLAPVTEADLVGPAEATRAQVGGVGLARDTRHILEKLAATSPSTLAVMHGSSFHGDGAQQLRALADAFDAT